VFVSDALKWQKERGTIYYSVGTINNNADMTSMKLPVLWSAEKNVSIPA
jgi:hypothetical protein